MTHYNMNKAQHNLKPCSTHLDPLNRLTLLWKHGITDWSQFAFFAARNKLILKPSTQKRKVEGVRGTISTHIHFLHAVLTETLNTIHNRFPPNRQTPHT
jgi:hypothetical protein